MCAESKRGDSDEFDRSGRTFQYGPHEIEYELAVVADPLQRGVGGGIETVCKSRTVHRMTSSE